jgi:D-glycero-alpha-D-manno-heptose-7-phosphate kinase
MKITASVPFRISFCGGGTDIPEFYSKYGGCVLSSAINKRIFAEIDTDSTDNFSIELCNYNLIKSFNFKELSEYKGDEFDIIKASLIQSDTKQPLKIKIHSEMKPGSGLGTSSATAVAMLAGLYYLKTNRLDSIFIAEEAIKLERKLLAIPGGVQDQYAVSVGGMNLIIFQKNKNIKIENLNLPESTRKALEKKLLIFYIKSNRNQKIHQARFVRMIKNQTSVPFLINLKSLCIEMKKALKNKDLTEFSHLLNVSWKIKKMANPFVANNKIDKLYNIAIKNGAVSGKLLGSGAGGYFLLYCNEERQRQVQNTLEKAGIETEKIKFENNEGVKIDEN